MCQVIENEPVCICYEGYELVNNQCQDRNECLHNPCHPTAICENVPGSYQCSCPHNMIGDPIHEGCRDPNECYSDADCHQSATCTNSRYKRNKLNKNTFQLILYFLDVSTYVRLEMFAGLELPVKLLITKFNALAHQIQSVMLKKNARKLSVMKILNAQTINSVSNILASIHAHFQIHVVRIVCVTQ